VGNIIHLSPEEVHHIFRVRRVRENDKVWVTDGAGLVYECRVQPDHSLVVETHYPDFAENRVPLYLCCAILKGVANRDVVDAAVQLGVAEVVFFAAQRSEGRLSEAAVAKLQRTAISALKQCGRARLPAVTVSADLSTALLTYPRPSELFLAHLPEAALPENLDLSPDAAVPRVLIVGPEGGLTDVEVEVAQRYGCHLLHLAPARLRSETAVVAGLTYLLSLAGECRAFRN
jgi:16S rRNA (uracil1498-N3)-methyltransferase